MQINNPKTLDEFYADIIPELIFLGVVDTDDIHEASRLPGWSTIKSMYMDGFGDDEFKSNLLESYINTLVD